MNNLCKIINEKLENKREELKKKQESFSIICGSEMNTKNFEKNAINDLLVMQQLKTEIAELEYLETMCWI